MNGDKLMTLLTFHLIAVSFWFGLLAAETVLELRPRDAGQRRTIAGIHRWIDTFFELPIVIAVLSSGGLLLARAWPPSPLLWFKVTAGLIAVLANLICIPFVLARSRAADDARITTLTRYIAMTGWGIPFALLAFAIGLFYLPGH
jgi:hypothetical protein